MLTPNPVLWTSLEIFREKKGPIHISLLVWEAKREIRCHTVPVSFAFIFTQRFLKGLSAYSFWLSEQVYIFLYTLSLSLHVLSEQAVPFHISIPVM